MITPEARRQDHDLRLRTPGHRGGAAGGPRRVTDFLEIPRGPAMLRYHDPSSAGILERMPEKRWQAHDNLRRPPTATLRDWRSELPAPSQLAFEALAGDLLEELGYERRALIDRQRRRPSA